MTLAGENEAVSCTISAGFHAWMSDFRGSIVLTTYQAGRVATLGFHENRVIPTFSPFAVPMGVACRDNLIAIASEREVTLFANAPSLAPFVPNAAPETYDSLYLPRVSFHTGDQRVHDVAFGQSEIWIVNTLLSCICTLSEDQNFAVKWKPSFISALAAEDRCHLNGMAMVAGSPRYMTALGATDTAGGWRANKASGGIVIDVITGEVLLRGLSMPHSPRWHDDKLWFLNSGCGELCIADLKQNTYSPVIALPGFLRGLCFAGNYAIIGLSQIRQSNLFGGLLVKERFPHLTCGVAIVGLVSGKLVGMLEFTSGLHEIFEIQPLLGVRRPMIVAAGSSIASDAVSSQAISYWLHKKTT